jgi:hypothetical protein
MKSLLDCWPGLDHLYEEAMRDNDADLWADPAPRPFHRCPSFLQDACRKCSYLPDDDEPEEAEDE